MPKEIISYQCEVCGRKYANESSARNCESMHKVPLEVEFCEYNNKLAIEIPSDIRVVFTDGCRAFYTLSKFWDNRKETYIT